MATSVHLRGRVVVPLPFRLGLDRGALLGSAVAEDPQKLRLEFVLMLLATERDDLRENMRTHHQHVVWLGVLQDRVDRLKPGDEYVGFGLGDLCPGVGDSFREIGRGGRFVAFWGRKGLGLELLICGIPRPACRRWRM